MEKYCKKRDIQIKIIKKAVQTGWSSCHAGWINLKGPLMKCKKKLDVSVDLEQEPISANTLHKLTRQVDFQVGHLVEHEYVYNRFHRHTILSRHFVLLLAVFVDLKYNH